MIWFLANIRLVGIAALVACIPIAYIIGGFSGKANCETKQVIEQAKTNEKARKKYDAVDKTIPYGASRSDRFKWLREYGD